jgi:hypothetical protein
MVFRAEIAASRQVSEWVERRLRSETIAIHTGGSIAHGPFVAAAVAAVTSG